MWCLKVFKRFCIGPSWSQASIRNDYCPMKLLPAVRKCVYEARRYRIFVKDDDARKMAWKKFRSIILLWFTEIRRLSIHPLRNSRQSLTATKWSDCVRSRSVEVSFPLDYLLLPQQSIIARLELARRSVDEKDDDIADYMVRVDGRTLLRVCHIKQKHFWTTL